MGLQIKHNRAEHTHENEQFRRIATSLKLLFEKQNWDGILIGNPYNENYSRFRPDGILLYNHGLIIIDLKAYSGKVILPPNKTEFESSAWYTESDSDKKRTLIKAGNRFINPFKQLDSYRNAFKEIVSHELGLKESVNEQRTCALNIFSGPLTIQNSIPKEIPYYKITQENDLGTMLYDYSSENSFSREIASMLSAVFNAEDWQERIEMPTPKMALDRQIEIDSDVETSISNFLKTKNSGVLILESMDSRDRDDWVEHILSRSQEFEIPQIETWIHSARIGRKISARMGMELQSLYNTIYGGSPKPLNSVDALDSEDEQIEEQLQETIPIRSDDSVDKSAVIILHEAHLVSRSLHQSELLRFGTGRLLEDLLTFLNLSETKRKLICIGDPYSLSYGKDTESAINPENISEHYSGKISRYRKSLVTDSFDGKLGLRLRTASGIENKKYNNLNFPWQTDDLSEITKYELPSYLTSWYGKPLDSEPSNAVIVFEKKDAKKINLWIKNHALKNGKDLSASDLLILNNNITIPDETGFAQPTKLYNGMFLLVNSIGETVSKTVPLKQSKNPIILHFTKVHVTCLSLSNRLETEIYLLTNYFTSEGGLSKEEQIAFRVFVNQLVGLKTKDSPFEESPEYLQMNEDKNYKEGLDYEANLKISFESGGKVKMQLEAQQRELRKIKRSYERKFKNRLFSDITKNDPFVNAGHVHYGWALTVHKCIGSSFSNAIINAYQGENRGTTNADYFRWLYSGVTTTTNTLLVANPQFIHPLMDTTFEDTSSVIIDVESSRKKLLTFSDYRIEERFKDKIPEDLKQNVIGAICELSLKLEEHGLLLESINPNGDYLTKAVYSEPSNSDSRVIIILNNNGQKHNWSVTSIRIEQCATDYQHAINQKIESLFAAKQESSGAAELEFPEDFRRPIYQNWNSVLNGNGYQLNLMESHKYQDVFSICGGINESAKFRVWYGDDEFIRKIVVLQKSTIELGQNLQKWLLIGNKA